MVSSSRDTNLLLGSVRTFPYAGYRAETRYCLSKAPERFILLLGNPGPEYAETRHNLGWWVGDLLAAAARARFRPGRSTYRAAEGRIGGVPVLLVKPMTFMNASGLAVADLARSYPVDADMVLIVADDVALPLGQIRIRREGSSGGHNGLASVIEHLGTEAVTRVRLGVGPVPERVDAAEFVLDQFGTDEFIVAREMAARAAEAITMILARGVEAAANVYNRKPPAPEPPTGEASGAN
ncbi:MAG TPA: aminoacyl-tRNA hydrolase [Acidobacteriota bacterium]|nr:aminoacyl-tRNA hydrolase [Acidobacteriota bacterium]